MNNDDLWQNPGLPGKPIKHEDVLQNLEFLVVQSWQEHPDLTDYAVERAYEAAFQIYRAEARGRTVKEPALTGWEGELLANLRVMCEWRLGREKIAVEEGADAPDEEPPPSDPLPLDELVDCLRRLLKSVQRHTRRGGRQGYLSFIKQFMS